MSVLGAVRRGSHRVRDLYEPGARSLSATGMPSLAGASTGLLGGDRADQAMRRAATDITSPLVTTTPLSRGATNSGRLTDDDGRNAQRQPRDAEVRGRLRRRVVAYFSWRRLGLPRFGLVGPSIAARLDPATRRPPTPPANESCLPPWYVAALVTSMLARLRCVNSHFSR